MRPFQDGVEDANERRGKRRRIDGNVKITNDRERV